MLERKKKKKRCVGKGCLASFLRFYLKFYLKINPLEEREQADHHMYLEKKIDQVRMNNWERVNGRGHSQERRNAEELLSETSLGLAGEK